MSNEIFLNIITPSIRPQNLLEISRTINIPRENYRWIVVFDLPKLPPIDMIPENCEYYLHVDKDSKYGNSQRNFALDLINDGYVCFNDDDTTIHPELWDNIKNTDCDFLSFKQNNKDGSLRLYGNIINVGKIDTNNFIVNRKIIKETRFLKELYKADGIFAKNCYENSNNKCWIDKTLSIYNSIK